jgi:phosphonatase-like hydrolase
MSTAIQLAVFDVAGTTVLDGDAVVESLRSALARHHVAVDRQDVVDVMGWPKPQAIRHLLDTHACGPAAAMGETAARIHDAFRADIIDRYRNGEGVSPAEGTPEIFSALRRHGVKVVLETGFSRDILDVLLQRIGWRADATIDLTITSDEVERGRPHPDLILRAMERLGIHQAAAVAKIGDTPADMIQGRAAGCGLVVGVTYGTHSRSQLEMPGVIIIDRLPELLPIIWEGAS